MNHFANKTLLAMPFKVIGHESLQSLAAQLGWSRRACPSILKHATRIMPDMKEVNLL